MRFHRRVAGLAVLSVLLIGLGGGAGIAVHRLWEFRNSIERLADELTLDAGPESTLLYDRSDQLVSAVFEEHRITVRLEDVSPHLVNAVLVTEDKRFYTHEGIDPLRILKAFLVNQRSGEIVQGASTITQQLVRSILLSREKTYFRKAKEVVLARRLEEAHSKQEILAAYLNRVYFGDGYYGVEAAALGYFGKPSSNLDAIESALLAGLIKGPSLYSPTKAPQLARQRRNFVLRRMREEGVLLEQDYQAAVASPLKVLVDGGERKSQPKDVRSLTGAAYFRETVARELIQRFGHEAVYTGGLRVYTTLDRRLQTLAEEVMASRLSRITPERHEPLQGAVVAIEPGTGFVKALVGGRDFRESPFNRAIDARRQPGSAFKPFIFAMALESGYGPSTELEGLDEPILTDRGPWLPTGEHEITSVRLRDALVMSSNRAAAHLLQDVGVRRTVDLVHRFGVTSELPSVPSLALGTGEMSLFELTSAYTVFANRGIWRTPTLIRRVVDRQGRELHRASADQRAVISDATAYLMTNMMADVVNRGTASTARAAGFHHAAAGKTGTSQSYADAWFVGYTPALVTGVWIGFDKPQQIMKRGHAGVVAVPVWARFMAAALEGTPSKWFEMPASVTKVRLCKLSGRLATERCNLPVVEAVPYDPDYPFALPAAIVHEGGTYEEVRHSHREPEICWLPHGESPGDHAHSHVVTAPQPAPGELSPGTPSGAPPTSMRSARPR